MDRAKLDQILAAFAMLAEAAGGTLGTKPNVDAVEAEIGDGVKVTGAERDEAWKAYEAAQEGDKDDSPESGDEGGAPVVRNAYISPLSIRDVTIPVGESRAVPGFDAEHGVLAKWLEAGVISVS